MYIRCFFDYTLKGTGSSQTLRLCTESYAVSQIQVNPSFENTALVHTLRTILLANTVPVHKACFVRSQTSHLSQKLLLLYSQRRFKLANTVTVHTTVCGLPANTAHRLKTNGVTGLDYALEDALAGTFNSLSESLDSFELALYG